MFKIPNVTYLLDKVPCHLVVEEIGPFEKCPLVPRLAILCPKFNIFVMNVKCEAIY